MERNFVNKFNLKSIRHCPNCGAANGVVRVYCKNDSCYASLTNSSSNTLQSHVCKISTNSFANETYSVCINVNDNDFRGFVQTYKELKMDATGLSFMVLKAKCRIKGCEKNSKIFVPPKALESVDNICHHILLTKTCSANAVPIALNQQMLRSLQFAESIKSEIDSLMKMCNAPLVQRVSLSTFAVKCNDPIFNPEMFVHCSLLVRTVCSQEVYQWTCQCVECAKYSNNLQMVGDDTRVKCVHYYAVATAIASHSDLVKEFKLFLVMETSTFTCLFVSNVSSSAVAEYEKLDRMLTNLQNSLPVIPSDSLTDNNFEPTFTSNNTLLDDATTQLKDLFNQTTKTNVGHDFDSTSTKKTVPANLKAKAFPRKQRMTDLNANRTSFKKTKARKSKPNTFNIENEKASKRMNENCVNEQLLDVLCEYSEHLPDEERENILLNLHNQGSHTENEDGNNTWSTLMDISLEARQLSKANLEFTDWLSTITELINRSMIDDQEEGARKISIHASQTFFDCLRERIDEFIIPEMSIVDGKSTLFGKHSKMIWNVSDIQNVKKIFDNTKVPLQSVRLLVRGPGGTYYPYEDYLKAAKEKSVKSVKSVLQIFISVDGE